MMKLERVTITGADDSTDPRQLYDLSEEFPFVEWGILVSRNQENTLRFPSRGWIRKLMHVVEGPMQLSTHMCGSWVRELLVGDLRWDDLPEVLNPSARVQINTHGEKHSCNYTRLMKNLRERFEKTFIIQLDGVNDYLLPAINWELEGITVSTAGLFDTSSGAGILPEEWPKATLYDCGYAGGLGPDNVVAQVEKIIDGNYGRFLSREKPFWIDMERRVRTEDDSSLDMAAVRKVLELTAPLVAITV